MCGAGCFGLVEVGASVNVVCDGQSVSELSDSEIFHAGHGTVLGTECSQTRRLVGQTSGLGQPVKPFSSPALDNGRAGLTVAPVALSDALPFSVPQLTSLAVLSDNR